MGADLSSVAGPEPETEPLRAGVAAEAPLDELVEGVVLAGKYRLEGRLGEGGMGVVYRASHLRLGTRVAVKVLAAGRDVALGRARLLREARVLAGLRSPHVVRMYDADVLPDGRPYVVLELVDGPSLAELLAARGRLPGEEVRRLILEVATGLAVVHDAGLVHRDVKPSNVLLAEEDGVLRAKLADFGIVRVPTAPGDATLTGDVGLVGSPHYVAPEQLRAPHLVDARADLFSLGATAYRMVTGRLPFEADGAAAVLAAIVADDPVPASQRAPDAPRELLEMIDLCLRKSRDARPSSAAHVVALLRGERSFDALPVTRGQAPSARRASLSIVVVAALGAVGTLWLSSSAAPSPSATARATAVPLVVASVAVVSAAPTEIAVPPPSVADAPSAAARPALRAIAAPSAPRALSTTHSAVAAPPALREDDVSTWQRRLRSRRCALRVGRGVGGHRRRGPRRSAVRGRQARDDRGARRRGLPQAS